MTFQVADHPLYDQLRQASGPAEKTERLFAYLSAAGQTFYDEAVTQMEHALQCAALADAEKADDATVLGALLHDFGHFLQDEHAGDTSFLTSDLLHEEVGAAFLDHFLDASITDPIRHHVVAKRYLCAVDSEYHDALSRASQRSLALQGGPLSQAEVDAMQSWPNLDRIVRIRRWDDQAKTAGKDTPGLEAYAERLSGAWRA